MAATVRFGNANPQMQEPILHPDDGVQIGSRSVPARHLNQSVTTVEFWDGVDDPKLVEHTLSTENDRMLALIGRTVPKEHRRYSVALHEMEHVLTVHCAGTKPAWVDSNNAELAKAIARYFDCPVGEPVALLTNGGRDALHGQHLGTSAQPASFNYIALTANSTTPGATDTTLTGEIATAGGGLLRAQATYAHTTGTNTSTLTKTFTANGSDSLAVTIAKIGIFNASSSGTMGYETLLTTTATLSVSGDSITVTETVTGG